VSSFCDKKLPTSDFEIAEARTSLCNVSSQSRTRNGSSRAAARASTATLALDLQERQPKPSPAGLPCELHAGIRSFLISSIHIEFILKKNR
jgi:hypothetical protein